jgi:hypothetical protein
MTVSRSFRQEEPNVSRPTNPDGDVLSRLDAEVLVYLRQRRLV